MGLFCFNYYYYCLFSILWPWNHGFFCEAKSDEAVQLNTRSDTTTWNHHSSSSVVTSTLQRTQCDVSKKGNMNCNSVFAISVIMHSKEREKERERAVNTNSLLTLLNRGNCSSTSYGFLRRNCFSHLIWTHFFNKKSTWRFRIPDFSKIVHTKGREKNCNKCFRLQGKM